MRELSVYLGCLAFAIVASLIAHRHVTFYLLACALAIAACEEVLILYMIYLALWEGLWLDGGGVFMGILFVAFGALPVVTLTGLPFYLKRLPRSTAAKRGTPRLPSQE